MITATRIENLRGIRSGAIKGLTLLSVLVGPNGCGKSTILDALLLAAGGAPGDAVGRTIHRRIELRGGGRWLFWRGGRTEDPSARILVESEGAPDRDVMLRLMPDVSPANEEKLIAKRARAPYVEIESRVKSGAAELTASTAVAHDSVYVFRQDGARELKETAVRLIDPRPGGNHPALWKSFSDAVEDGRLEEVEKLVAEVVPGFKHLQNLSSDDAGHSVVHLAFEDHSVPVALAGDGIQTLVQVCFAVAQRPGSVVLLEEPEATQHPRSLYQSALAIATAVKRGVQVILSTHSLDLIDALRTHLGDDLPKLSVHHLACPGGEMSVVRYSGAEIALARDTIGEDLR